MTDTDIIASFWSRSENAVAMISEKYGAYCTAIARNILASPEDAEECANDTWMHVWNAIPPERPACLSAYVGKIVRNLAVSRLRHNTAQKRGETPLILEELGDLVSGEDTPETEYDRQALLDAIREWLMTNEKRDRQIFVRRYWHSERVADIAARFSISEGNTSMILLRMRRALSAYLKERGFEL